MKHTHMVKSKKSTKSLHPTAGMGNLVESTTVLYSNNSVLQSKSSVFNPPQVGLTNKNQLFFNLFTLIIFSWDNKCFDK